MRPLVLNPQEHNLQVMRSWIHPGVLYYSYVATTLWYLGYPDQALEKAQSALSLAQEVTHPYSVAFALTRIATLHFARGEVQASQEHVEALIALATEQEFPDVLALETARQGAGLVEQGEVEAGMAQLQHGVAGMQALGQEIGRPYFLACLAKAYAKQGQTEGGRQVMAEALAVVDKIGERYYEAELYVVKGELTLQKQSGVRGPASEVTNIPESRVKTRPGSLDTKSQILDPKVQGEATACFLKAINIARKQQAKLWELRATTSLARLWQQQGKQRQAHKMLSAIYNWFTEGFDTKDLQEAKALLDELGFQ